MATMVRTEVFDSNIFRRLLDDRPNRPVAQLVADQLPALGERPQQAAVLDLRRYHPGVDCGLFSADDYVALGLADQLANGGQANVHGRRAQFLLQHGCTIFHEESTRETL